MIITGMDIFKRFKDILDNTKDILLIASAWIGYDVLEKLFESTQLDDVKDKRIVIRASEPKDLEIDRPETIKLLLDNGFKIAFHKNLHAKFVLSDEKIAIIGSSNLTTKGFEGGNKELSIVIEDDEDKLKEIKANYEQIWSEALKVSEKLVGITMNPGKTGSVEFLVLSPEQITENSFVIIKNLDGSTYLCRINSIMIYDTSFFMNPFTTPEGEKFPSFKDFEFLHWGDFKEWKIGSVYSFINHSKGGIVNIATADVLGKIESGELKSVLRPISPKLWVELPEREILENVSKPKVGVKIGKFYNLDSEYYIDLEEVSKTHMAVLGTTGSGKSYFAKLFISRVAELYDVGIFIIDPHGEYAEFFKNHEEANVVEIPEDLLLIDDAKDLKNVLNEFFISRSGFETIYNKLSIDYTLNQCNKDVLSFLKDSIKDIETIKFDKSYKDIAPLLLLKKSKESELKRARERFKDMIIWFLENISNKLKDSLEKIEQILKRSKKITVFDFSSVSDPEARVRITAYFAKDLFEKAKNDSWRRLLILEEAHNFVPEKGIGDVTAGKTNPAYRILTKIASEGRKFNLSLISITQRPANLSKYILSQANTTVIFRLVNDSDLKAVQEGVESVSKDVIKLLPSLKRGEAFVFGLGASLPALVKIDEFF